MLLLSILLNKKTGRERIVIRFRPIFIDKAVLRYPQFSAE